MNLGLSVMILCAAVQAKCFVIRTPRRHLFLNRLPNEVPCFEHTVPGGCVKRDCLFKHQPRCKTVGIQVEISSVPKMIKGAKSMVRDDAEKFREESEQSRRKRTEQSK